MAAFGEDRARAFIDLVERKRPDLLREHLDSMLHRAVLSGTLATVKVILIKIRNAVFLRSKKCDKINKFDI